MSYLRLPPKAYDRLLAKDPKTIQMDICDYITYLKKSGIVAPSSLRVYLAALRKFYVMNDVTQLNWAKIHSFLGENEKQTEDRPYTHSEIQMLLEKTTSRNRCIILLMCSAGLRVGAIASLRIRDIEPIDKYQIYKVNVYATSRKSHYFSFCTPECRKEIDSYLEWRKRWGERLTDDSPLFRSDHNSQVEYFDKDRRRVKSFQTGTIRWFVGRLLRDTGIRPVIPSTETISATQLRRSPPRSHIMQCHGFRKFFETNAFKAGMNNMFIRRLLGQKAGLEDSYLKLTQEDLLEGSNRHTGFVDIIDQLTIDESNKLRREVETLKVEKNSWEALRVEVDNLKTLLKQP